MASAPFIPVIPAGGAGTRLWPLSRRRRPNYSLCPTGLGRSLLQQTVERLGPLPDGRPIVFTGAGHTAEVGEQLGGAACVLSEPEPRNSMPAIAWAAAVVEREDPDAVIGSFAADHLIGDEEADRKSTRLNSSHVAISYAVFCLKTKRRTHRQAMIQRGRP